MSQLWLDDLRPPPEEEGWVWAKTAQEAIDYLATNEVTIASLDHDLGDVHYNLLMDPEDKEAQRRAAREQTGYDVVLWLCENPDHWPTEKIIVHSWNSVGGGKMAGTINRHGPYEVENRCRHIPDPRPMPY